LTGWRVELHFPRIRPSLSPFNPPIDHRNNESSTPFVERRLYRRRQLVGGTHGSTGCPADDSLNAWSKGSTRSRTGSIPVHRRGRRRPATNPESPDWSGG